MTIAEVLQLCISWSISPASPPPRWSICLPGKHFCKLWRTSRTTSSCAIACVRGEPKKGGQLGRISRQSRASG